MQLESKPVARAYRAAAPLDQPGIATVLDVGETINAGDTIDLDGPGPLPEGAITGSLELTETTCTFTFVATPTGAAPD